MDTLLRTNGPNGPTTADNAAARAEIGLIYANGLRVGSLPPTDRAYLAQVVVARTGAPQADAERRVDAGFAQLEESADTARKAVAHSMYWTFLALIIGAFCATFAATIGGRERDRVPVL